MGDGHGSGGRAVGGLNTKEPVMGRGDWPITLPTVGPSKRLVARGADNFAVPLPWLQGAQGSPAQEYRDSRVHRSLRHAALGTMLAQAGATKGGPAHRKSGIMFFYVILWALRHLAAEHARVSAATLAVPKYTSNLTGTWSVLAPARNPKAGKSGTARLLFRGWRAGDGAKSPCRVPPWRAEMGGSDFGRVRESAHCTLVHPTIAEEGSRRCAPLLLRPTPVTSPPQDSKRGGPQGKTQRTRPIRVDLPKRRHAAPDLLGMRPLTTHTAPAGRCSKIVDIGFTVVVEAKHRRYHVTVVLQSSAPKQEFCIYGPQRTFYAVNVWLGYLNHAPCGTPLLAPSDARATCNRRWTARNGREHARDATLFNSYRLGHARDASAAVCPNRASSTPPTTSSAGHSVATRLSGS
eukprot:gene14488-biopygen11154